MSKIENLISTLRGVADGEEVIALGFVCDISEQPCNLKGFVIGRENELAEALTHLLNDEVVRKVFSKALAQQVSRKIMNLAKEKSNENGHQEYN